MSYPSFSVGEVLTAADMNAVGLWLVKTQTVGTGVASVIVTNAFSADYDNYRITYTGGSSNANGELLFTLRNGASELLNSWTYTVYGFTYAGATITGGLNNAAFCVCGGRDVGFASAVFDISHPHKTTMKFVHGVTYAAGQYAAATAAVSTNTSAWPDFKISPNVGGTLTGGTIRVYGYRN